MYMYLERAFAIPVALGPQMLSSCDLSGHLTCIYLFSTQKVHQADSLHAETYLLDL